MALAPPDELPVYDYRAWIDQLAADTHPDFTIDKLDTTSTVSGDTATVKLDASGTTGSGERPGQVAGRRDLSDPIVRRPSVSSSRTHRRPGRSVTQTGENGGGAYSSSSGGRASTVAGASACRATSGRHVPFGLFPFDSGDSTPSSGPISIKVVRENGRWFVSPVTHRARRGSTPRSSTSTSAPSTRCSGWRTSSRPTATITLDQPFTVPSRARAAQQLGVRLRRYEGPEGHRREQRQQRLRVGRALHGRREGRRLRRLRAQGLRVRICRPRFPRPAAIGW